MNYYYLLGDNIKERKDMKLIETSKYKRDYKDEILKKHKTEEQNEIEDIKTFLISKDTLQDVINDPLCPVYNIRKKKGNLKQYYTADVNRKMRLFLKPIGKYPYNTIEISEIELSSIDNHHYGEG